jgi:thymidylate synthase (FAD)
LRRQDTKNRQNSIDDIGEYEKLQLQGKIQEHFAEGMRLYKELLKHDVAKECARFVLPLATPTRIYMSGSCRSWITLHCSSRKKWNSKRAHGYCRGV